MPAFEIEILSKQETDAIWKARGKRADDFSEYVDFVNLREVGDSFRIKVPKEPLEKNDEEAKKIRYNFLEAAKERVRAYGPLDAQPTETTNGIEAAEWKETDGKWYAHKVEPFVLRVKVDSHVEKVTVTDKGKKGTTDQKVIDALTFLAVASDTIRKRGPRQKKVETAETPTTNGHVEGTPLDDVKPADTPEPATV